MATETNDKRSANGPGAELLALQFADSFFPSGAISFSLGLETLAADGRVSDASGVGKFLNEQIHARWATADRAFMAASFRAHGDLKRVAELDALQEAMMFPAELRDGSRRNGAALLGVHARLETPGAAPYRAMLRDGGAHGHLSVVQGLVFAGAGLDLARGEAVSAHGFAVAVLGAALRLGLIGHLDAQRLLGGLHHALGAILAKPAPEPEAAASYAPLSDIAVMRHESQDSRLFAN